MNLNYYDNHGNPVIKVSIAVSFLFHIAVVAIIFLISHFSNSNPFITGDVYTIDLVGNPAIGNTMGTITEPSPITMPTNEGPKAITDSKASNSDNEPVPVKSKPVTAKTNSDDLFNKLSRNSPQSSASKPRINFNSNSPVVSKNGGSTNPSNTPKIKQGGNTLGAVRGSSNLTLGTPNGSPGGIGAGGMLNGKPFPDPYYLLSIQTKINGNWSPPANISGKGPKNLVVFFTINRNGKVSDIQVERPSGSVVLDQSSLRAVQLSNPLPPIPPVVKDDILRIHFTFTYAN